MTAQLIDAEKLRERIERELEHENAEFMRYNGDSGHLNETRGAISAYEHVLGIIYEMTKDGAE